MCKHEEIVLASRNAIVALREVIAFNESNNEELSRRENAYDFLLEDLKLECRSCEYDFKEANHACFKEVCDCYSGRDFLRFLDEYVEHFGGAKCEACK